MAVAPKFSLDDQLSFIVKGDIMAGVIEVVSYLWIQFADKFFHYMLKYVLWHRGSRVTIDSIYFCKYLRSIVDWDTSVDI